MSIFSLSKKRDQLMLVFNIGSSSVEGALFFAQKSGIPKIIFSVKELIKIEQNLEINNFLSSTIRALEVVVNKIYMARLGAPSKIFCVLSSPWTSSQTRVINLKKNVPFIFTAKLADDLIQREIKRFEEEHLSTNDDINTALRAIELKNIKTRLNGYETPKPLNKKTKEVEITIFVSTSGEQFLKKIEATINKHFYFEQIKFSSFILSFFTVVRDVAVNQSNFLLVDIGGEVTDISMIKNNTLRESISFPIGRNFLARSISSSLNCSLNEANSFFSLLKDGHAEASMSERLIPIINKLKIEWLKKFQESLANLSHDISIPATIYMNLDQDLADFFKETIKTEQFSQYTLTESKFEVIIVTPGLLHDLVSFIDNVSRGSNIMIDSTYINRFIIKSN